MSQRRTTFPGNDPTDHGLHTVRLRCADDFQGWRDSSRHLLQQRIPPDAVVWDWGEATPDLFSDSVAPAPTSHSTVRLEAATQRHLPGKNGATRQARQAPMRCDSAPQGCPSTNNLKDNGDCASPAPESLRVPRAFLQLAEYVACHRNADRFARLYRVLWRRACGETHLFEQASDPDMHRLRLMARNVSRERHKMHAFVRFRQMPGVEPEHYLAWFEPIHHTLRLASGFFVRRFTNMHWSIVTPEQSAHWNGETLQFGAGGRQTDVPKHETMETLWCTYFASIFNPSRLNTEAMQAEMAKRYWKNLPEAPLIADLVQQAGQRTESMIQASPTSPPRYATNAKAPRASSKRPSTEDVTHHRESGKDDTC